LLVGGLVFLCSPAKQSSPEDMTAFANGFPSAWLLRVMNVISTNMVYCIPGAFVCPSILESGDRADQQIQVSIRYEHSRLTPVPAPQGAPGEPVLIDYKTFTMPLYRFMILALLACCLLADAIGYSGYTDEYMAEQIIILMTAIPVVVGGTAVYTFIRGDFKDWWNYAEE
jgi:hypothetical protein